MACVLLIFLASAAFTVQAAEPKFTEEEERFINTHPVIHLCVDPDFVPYEFIDSDGQYKGIAADYIKLLSEKTGIQMIAGKNLTWNEAYELAVEKKLDVLPCVAKTPQREQYFLYTKPYIEFQRVIVVQDSNHEIKNLGDLRNVPTAVQKNSSHHGYLAEEHPEIPSSPYATVEDALTAVSIGSETAFIGNLATTSYLIKQHGFTNLKFIIINNQNMQLLYFAVRNDWPVLVGIINKGLTSITEEEKIEINNKWIGVENEIDYGPVIRIIIVILLFLAISLFWIFRLRREVKKRILIEEELRHAKQEAEIANQVKSVFLARMSHEIRTPLNAIMGMSYLVKRTDVNMTQKMYLDKITQASHTMLGIINDILDFSKIEAGKVELEMISFHLDLVIQEVINIISFKVEEQGIEFRMSRDPKIPEYFFGDPKRIEQILINLINNAVKFTSSGEVSLEINLLSRRNNLCELEFCVRDTGIGMSDEQASQLFVPFAQGDSSINRRFGGTGLGLSIVKSLTELMCGEISVESTLGKGSIFTVKLPLETDQDKNLEERRKASAAYFSGIRALILDRSAADLRLMQSYLGSFGISAELAESETKALELLSGSAQTSELLSGSDQASEKHVNLFILDYETPAELGIEFIEKLRSESKLPSDVKVIMTVPLSREDIFQRIEETGIDFGIAKPVIPSILYNGILEVFKELMMKPENPITPDVASAGGKAANDYQVLVVEDNKTNQLIVREILEQAGYRVTLADNGEEGVDSYRDHRKQIDLILMDLHMPVMNGYEASSIIREFDSEVPIVAMTADAIAGVDEECRKAGIDHYISKPFDPEKFTETLLYLLRPHKPKEKGDGRRDGNPPKEEADDRVLDISDGMKRIGNNEELYKAILNEFLIEFQDVKEELNLQIQARNYEAAIQTVHKFKGGSGSIGSKKAASVSMELQKALKEESDQEIERLSGEFSHTVEMLFDQAGKYIREGQPK